MNKKFIFGILIIGILVISLVSAGLFGRLTGNAVQPMKCSESAVCVLSTMRPTAVYGSYTLTLVSASDASATIKVTDSKNLMTETKEIEEGTSKIVGGLKILVKSADEKPRVLSAKIMISESSSTEVTYEGVLEMLSNIKAVPVHANTPHWNFSSSSCDFVCKYTVESDKKTCVIGGLFIWGSDPNERVKSASLIGCKEGWTGLNTDSMVYCFCA